MPDCICCRVDKDKPEPPAGSRPKLCAYNVRASQAPGILQNTPDSSPPDSPRTPPPPKRGSTTSPGQEALTAGGRWLAVLVCCHHKAGLDAGGQSLINDLVQLLYYHGSGVAQQHGDDESDATAHLLSPVVQVCDLTLCLVCDSSLAIWQCRHAGSVSSAYGVSQQACCIMHVCTHDCPG